MHGPSHPRTVFSRHNHLGIAAPAAARATRRPLGIVVGALLSLLLWAAIIYVLALVL